MLAKVQSCAVIGLEGALIEVEVDLSNGLAAFTIVGLPDASVLGVLWSVAIEEQFYLAWPLILSLCLGLMFVALLTRTLWVALAGFVLTAMAAARWMWPAEPEKAP